MTSNTKLVLGVLGIVIVGAVGYYAMNGKDAGKQSAFTINGQAIALVDGKYEVESAPGSASKTTTTYFGNEAKGDFNGDGTTDTAFIVTQNSGGSGTFFYLATTLGGEAVLLGDRIAPQSTNYIDGKIVVNYAERKPGEPMTASPSVGVSKYFEIKNGTLVETSAGATTTTTTTGKKIAFTQLMGQGGTYKCSVNQTVGQVTTKGTVYMDKGLLRGEFAADYAGQKVEVSFIMRDGFTYMWNSMMPTQGFKIKNDTTVQAGGVTANATGAIQTGSPSDYLSQIGDYDCQPWAAEDSKFTLPTSVTFKAMN